MYYLSIISQSSRYYGLMVLMSALSLSLIGITLRFIRRDQQRHAEKNASVLLCRFVIAIGLYVLVLEGLMTLLEDAQPFKTLWAYTDVGVLGLEKGVSEATKAAVFHLLVVVILGFLALIFLFPWLLVGEVSSDGATGGVLFVGTALLAALFWSVPFNERSVHHTSAIFPSGALVGLLMLWVALMVPKPPVQRFVSNKKNQQKGKRSEDEAALPEEFIARELWEASIAESLDIHVPEQPAREFKEEEDSRASRMRNYPAEWSNILRVAFEQPDLVPDFVEPLIQLVEERGDAPSYDQPTWLIAEVSGAGKSRVAWSTALRFSQGGSSVLIIYPSVEQADRSFNELKSLFERLSPRLTRLEGHSASLTQELEAPHGVYVTDIDWLSEYMLPQHRTRELLIRSLEAIVFEDIHVYSGIRGANVWAISRRMWRVLLAYGVQPSTLATLTARRMEGGKHEEFVRRLFGRTVRHVTPGIRGADHEVRIYPIREIGHQTKDVRLSEVGEVIHSSLLAGEHRIGIDGRIPLDLRNRELLAKLSKREITLPVERDRARVWVTALNEENLMSIIDEAAEVGRLSGHHEVLTLLLPVQEPFLKYAMSGDNLEKFLTDIRRSSKAYFCDSENIALVRKHIQAALNEYPETRERLEKLFDSTELVGSVLDELAFKGRLNRQIRLELRDNSSEVGIETYFWSEVWTKGNRPVGSVGTISDTPISITLRLEGERQIRQVDPERVAIDAFGGKVIVEGGRRYRIENWSKAFREQLDKSSELVEDWGGLTIPCVLDDDDRTVKAIRDIQILEISPFQNDDWTYLEGAPDTSSFYYAAVTIQLRAQVTGWVDSRGQHEQLESVPKVPQMTTKALLLDFRRGSALPEDGLRAIASGLERILCLFIGVRSDDILVEPYVFGEQTFLAVIDFHQGGTGLVVELPKHLPTILGALARWFKEVSCCGSACEACIEPPEVRLAKRGPIDRLMGYEILSGNAVGHRVKMIDVPSKKKPTRFGDIEL